MWRVGLVALIVVLAGATFLKYWDTETSATPWADSSDHANSTPEFVGDPPLDFTSWEAYIEWSTRVPIRPVNDAGEPLLPDRPNASCEELQDAAEVPEAQRGGPSMDQRMCPGVLYEVLEPRPIPQTP
jgi:hypothetical protein